MLTPHRPRDSSMPQYKHRLSMFVDRNFQLLYTRRMLGIVVVSTLVYAIPLFYLINQNYNFLSRLAYSMAPRIASHIDGEQVVFNAAIIGVLISQWLLIAIFGRRMTEKIIAPLKKIRFHLKQLARGDLKQKEVRVRATDEFQDLVSSYNYYYLGLREQTKRDLLKLLKIRTAIKHPETLHTINEMIHERAAQLDADLLLMDKHVQSAAHSDHFDLRRVR